MTHAAVTDSLAERLQELGGIVADRVRSTPAPGTATLDDLIYANDHTKPLCELIDNTLVEKAVGFEASVVAVTIAAMLKDFVAARRLGVVSGSDGFFRLLDSSATAVYTTPVGVTVLDEEATITGGDVLPGFECAVADFFSDLDPDSL